jgi:hypothetical protein
MSCNSGRPVQDAFFNTLNTNRFQVFCHHPSRWAQLCNDRVAFATITSSTSGLYTALDSTASDPIFNSHTGDLDLVTVGGTHSGTITFNQTGTYKISTYIELQETSDESGLGEFWNALVCFSPSTVVPTSTTPIQMLALLAGNSNYSSASQEQIITVTAGDVWEYYNILANNTSKTLTYGNFLVTIVQL